jgi:hypothetical protein
LTMIINLCECIFIGLLLFLIMQATRKVLRVTPATAVFFECDVQVKMQKHIINFDAVAQNSARMAMAAKTFEVPVIATH